MKIKHFAGYGSVNAVKLHDIKLTNNINRLTIKVVGRHECGLYRDDKYDIFNWLVKRFCKKCKSYKQIDDILIDNGYEKITGVDVEYCIYFIHYNEN